MKHRTIALSALLAVSIAACNTEQAELTTTSLDAALLTTTTQEVTETTEAPESTNTTEEASDQIESFEIISRTSDESGETLYILVPPGDYSDVSMENFLGDLLEDETAVAGVEIFDHRAALDGALKDEADQTADDLQAIEDHHLVSLTDGREVDFQGPMSDYQDFVVGS